MNSDTPNSTAPTPRTFTRHDLKAILPTVVRRVHSAEFTSQADIAREYGVDKATATRWKQRALSMGLTDNRAWCCGLLLAQMNQTLTA